MARYTVSHGTAQRATATLAAEGLVAVRRGHRATVANRPAKNSHAAAVINIRGGGR